MFGSPTIPLYASSSLHFTDKIGQALYLGSSGSAKGPNFEASPPGVWWLAWSPIQPFCYPFKGTKVPHIFTITVDEHPPTLCNTTISTTSAVYLTICNFSCCELLGHSLATENLAGVPGPWRGCLARLNFEHVQICELHEWKRNPGQDPPLSWSSWILCSSTWPWKQTHSTSRFESITSLCKVTQGDSHNDSRSTVHWRLESISTFPCLKHLMPSQKKNARQRKVAEHQSEPLVCFGRPPLETDASRCIKQPTCCLA